ncbi:MAG TPA: DUF3152 domain-containing protein [Jatrophihabitans sp.]|nr:DUF3152 domain-containing protein [Jatrophihabitans sp.]
MIVLRADRLVAAIALSILGGLLAAPTPAAATPRISYTYQVRGLANRSDLTAFAASVAASYADSRGWNLGGSIAFRQVSSGGQFTVWLAAAQRVPGFGSPCDSSYSCTVGNNVIINETRWLSASPSWTAGHGSLTDYRHMVVNHETGHWLGFGHSFCAGPGQLAPVMQQQSISLQGCRPNAWPLASERARLAVSRGVPILTGYPIGALDPVIAGLAQLRIRGWSIDPDTAASTRVSLYVDGGGLSVPADVTRPDVGAAHPGYGSAHGFDLRLTVVPGRHTVCAYGLNLAGPGGASGLGCRSVVVSASPTGHLDSVTASSWAVQAGGWVIDPDTVAAGRVAVYVDAGGVSAPADLPRADLVAVYPHFGAGHGFAVTVPAAPGSHRVCGYAINTAGRGANVLLGCRLLTVPASTSTHRYIASQA